MVKVNIDNSSIGINIDNISFIIMLSKVMPSLNNLLLATQHYIDMNTNNSVKIIMNVFSKVPDMVNRMTGVDVTNVRTIHEKYL